MSNENADKIHPPMLPCVRWYYQGAVNNEPRTAIVTSARDDGVLELTILAKGASHLTTASGVRHKDDPYHATHPTHAKDCGCWDHYPAEGLIKRSFEMCSSRAYESAAKVERKEPQPAALNTTRK